MFAVRTGAPTGAPIELEGAKHTRDREIASDEGLDMPELPWAADSG